MSRFTSDRQRKKVMSKIKTKIYFIKPMNEGQELNYIEKYEGTYKNAKKRANEIRINLQKTLKEGTIDVEIEDG
jgi:hypothetical protein